MELEASGDAKRFVVAQFDTPAILRFATSSSICAHVFSDLVEHLRDMQGLDCKTFDAREVGFLFVGVESTNIYSSDVSTVSGKHQCV